MPLQINELPKGADVLAALDRALTRPDELRDAYARAVLDVAKRKAAGRPTPQAAMVAGALTVRSGAIQGSGAVLGPNAASLGDLLWGSERGSTLYRQFGPRSSSGYWLMPATESRDALDPAQRTLDAMIAAAVRHG